MKAERSPHTLLLVLVATAVAGWSTVRANCVLPPPGIMQVTTGAGQVLWACSNASTTWPNLQRVVRSACENGSLIEAEMRCEIPGDPTLALSCTSQPPVVANAVTEALIPDLAVVYRCKVGYAWLSRENEQVSQCYKDAWTPILDMCDPECSMPRDCAQVNALGHNTTGLYVVHPSGDSHETAVRVHCNLSDVGAEGGWLLAAYTEPGINGGSTDTTNATNGFSDPQNPPYFVGLKILAELNWDQDSPRPLVYLFTVRLADDPRILHATYTHVQLTREMPWNLTLDAPYHGDAGDFFSSISNYSTWTDDRGFMSLFQEPLPLWIGQTLDMIKLYVRPTSYDQATSCPSLVGIHSSWRHTWAQVPQSRAPGARIDYRCSGALRARSEATDGLSEIVGATQASSATTGNNTSQADQMQAIAVNLLPAGGNTTAETGISNGGGRLPWVEGSWSKEGFVECKKKASGEFVWTASLELPCLLQCPDNYTKSADELSCIRIHHFGDDFGITTASLRCHEAGASLAPVDRVPANSSLLLSDRYYYTASIRRTAGWMPQTNLPCAANEECYGNDRHACYGIRTTQNGVLEGRAQSCVQNDTGFICTWPAWCPDDYKEYRGLCFKVAADLANISSGQPEYTKGMLGCMTEGASLAYPENLGALNFLAHLVREKEINRTSQPYESDLDEEKIVITGLYGGKGDWTGGGAYSPDRDVLQLAGEDPSKYYRLLRVPQTLRENVTLQQTKNYIRNLTVHYAACQLYGLTDCREPPRPGANMTLVTSNATTRYNTTIGYKCYPGYYSRGDVTWGEQWVRCFASMGGWMYPARPEIEPFVDCLYAEVCNDTTVLETVGPNPNITFSPDHRYMSGEINIICPPGLSTTLGNTTQDLTCSKSNETFGYLPQALPCNVCKGRPGFWGANFTWNENHTYVTDDTINATCKENYLTKMREDRVKIMCREWGWRATAICYKVCTDPLPVPGANMTLEEAPNGTVVMGDTALYRCSPGTYRPQSYPDVKSKLILTCKSGAWKPSLQEDPFCAILCLADPPSSPPLYSRWGAPLETSWDGTTRTAGTQVELWCTKDRVLPDLSTNITVKCGEDGNWTHVDLDPLICRRVATEPPPLPPGSEMEGQAPPHYWEGDVVGYRCPPNKLSPAGTNNTSTHFNGSHWTLDDPAFECLPMCAMDPPMPPPPGNSTWDGWTRVAYTQVELTCRDPYLFPNLNTSINITCHFDTLNWTYVDSEDLLCRILALEPPPLPTGSEMEGPVPLHYWEGDVVGYRCAPDKLSPTGSNTNTAHFNGSHWTLDDPTFQCLPVCWTDPPTPQGPGNSTWDGQTRFANTSVVLTCPDPYLFANLITSITTTCHPHTLNWTFVDANPCLSAHTEAPNTSCHLNSSSDISNLLHCRILAVEPPPLPPRSEMVGLALPHYWEGDVVRYHCPPNNLSPAGTNITTAHFNSSHWVLADPTFECLPTCTGPPPAPRGGMEWVYGGGEVWGAVATYICHTHFPDGNKTLNTTCNEGNWTLTELPQCAGVDGEGTMVLSLWQLF